MEFISKDDKTIKLPVPLGSKVYRINSECCMLCHYFPERRKNEFTKDEITCTVRALCHTIPREPTEDTLTLKSMHYILEGCGTIFFPSIHEARKRIQINTSKRRAELRKRGFDIDEVTGRLK